MYIDIKPQTKEANRTIPVVAFTVPTQVADDVSADNSITVTTQGSNTVVAAAGKAATGLEFSCYMNAKDFSHEFRGARRIAFQFQQSGSWC